MAVQACSELAGIHGYLHAFHGTRGHTCVVIELCMQHRNSQHIFFYAE